MIRFSLIPLLLWVGFHPASALDRIGESTFSVLFWDIYTAQLFNQDGRYQGLNGPLRLSLTYHRQIDANDLLEATESQWQRMGYQDAASRQWLQQMGLCFPDVDTGHTLSFYLAEDSSARLDWNGQRRCDFDRSEGNRQFLAIWLSQDSADPDFTRQLTGEPGDQP
ncbi:Chalcone isomerase-like [Ferrimonas sediminum]|uniref:Chalcone isomerase-like n=1 Tax=Ferrimonas sediminum TaxID=718193 RepID=A0A1G8QC05_9GAMM|nr:chalcone isomerase family protein [Ferrimonas sediminum]SDJ01630.1 Chalcone isomerase-like [Ferrimonas sediminum]